MLIVFELLCSVDFLQLLYLHIALRFGLIVAIGLCHMPLS